MKRKKLLTSSSYAKQTNTLLNQMSENKEQVRKLRLDGMNLAIDILSEMNLEEKRVAEHCKIIDALKLCLKAKYILENKEIN